ncbi:MAG: redox-regulated ATPase YchF [Deltaproteobacteria bacterium]|nr:redox-regulated ATPase YchF [Deltaproteobacteria bacterium]
MSLSCGIVGLPNAGKSTIFNALTQSRALVADYPFTTIEPNVGIVNIPDERLQRLAELIRPHKIIPATLKFIDIAGLVKGASKGEGLGNKFLGHIREVDALLHVVRCFESDVAHDFESVDPKRDVEVVNLELTLADLETVERRKEKVAKIAKSGNREAQVEYGFLERIEEHLCRGNTARKFMATGETEEKFLLDLNLLTNKPVLYVANLEETMDNEYGTEVLKIISEGEHAGIIKIFGKLELELQELAEEEMMQYLLEIGFSESGLSRLVKASYGLLGLVTFYTTNGVELRAWSVKSGTKAPKAAGKIHSDFEKGFIRAEVISYEDFIKCGSDSKARELGLLRIEGKDYQIEDGNMVYFRFKN